MDHRTFLGVALAGTAVAVGCSWGTYDGAYVGGPSGGSSGSRTIDGAGGTVTSISSTMQGPAVPSRMQASTGQGVALGPKTLPSPFGPILAIVGVLAVLGIVGVAIGVKRHFAAAPVITSTAQGLVSSALASASAVSSQPETSSAPATLAPAIPPSRRPRRRASDRKQCRRHAPFAALDAPRCRSEDRR